MGGRCRLGSQAVRGISGQEGGRLHAAQTEQVPGAPWHPRALPLALPACCGLPAIVCKRLPRQKQEASREGSCDPTGQSCQVLWHL